MDLGEAKKVMNEPVDDRAFGVVMAAAEICSPENSGQVTICELLDCLKRGNESRQFALVAEYAATALYARTKRAWPSEGMAITDTDDWTSYLREHKFI